MTTALVLHSDAQKATRFLTSQPAWAALHGLTLGMANRLARHGYTSAARQGSSPSVPMSRAAQDAADGCAHAALTRAAERYGFLLAPSDACRQEVLRGALSAVTRADRSATRAALDGGGSSVRDEATRESIDAAGEMQASEPDEAISDDDREVFASVFASLTGDEREALRCAMKGKRIPGLSRSQSNRRIARAREVAAIGVRARIDL